MEINCGNDETVHVVYGGNGFFIAEHLNRSGGAEIFATTVFELASFIKDMNWSVVNFGNIHPQFWNLFS